MEWHFRNRISTRFPYTDRKINFPMQNRWSITLPSGIITPPIFAQNAIFVAAVEGLYKLSSTNGAILWRIAVEEGKALQHSPSYYGGKIYYSSSLSTGLYCIDAETGKKIWETDKGAFGESPCFYRDSIFLKCRKAFEEHEVYGYARYTLDMQEQWFHPCEGRINADTCAIDKDYLVYSDNKGYVYGVDTNTGAEIWKMSIPMLLKEASKDDLHPDKQDIPYASEIPVIIGNTVVILAQTPGQTFGLDISSGKVLWSYIANTKEKWHYFGQGFDSRRWYCIMMEKLDPKHYLGIDINTGKVDLKVEINKYKENLGYILSKTGLVIGNYHFIGVYDSPKIAAFNTTIGELEWTHPINRTNLRGDSTGIYADSKVIWVRRTGDIYCFE